jgi:hypothetical protein
MTAIETTIELRSAAFKGNAAAPVAAPAAPAGQR